MCACFILWLIISLTLMSILVIFKRKEFDNCSLFRCLFLIPTIAENPTSHVYENENGSSIFIASAERIGNVSWDDNQNWITLLRLNWSFKDEFSDKSMSSSSAFVDIPVYIASWNGFTTQIFCSYFSFLQESENYNYLSTILNANWYG